MNLRQISNRFAFGWLKRWLLYRYLSCEQQATVIRRSLVDVGRIIEDNRINRLYLENGLWRDVFAVSIGHQLPNDILRLSTVAQLWFESGGPSKISDLLYL